MFYLSENRACIRCQALPRLAADSHPTLRRRRKSRRRPSRGLITEPDSRLGTGPHSQTGRLSNYAALELEMLPPPP